MSNKNKKIFAGSMAAVMLLGASSLAWFTDRTQGSIEGQAGNLCLEMTDIVGDLDNLAPGDNRELSFEYANLGSLSMDTRVTYVLSYTLDEDVANVIENDLSKVATLSVGEEELVLTADESRITGTFETGTIKGAKEDVGLDKLAHTLNFNFDKSVGNIGQKMKFKLDVLVEGKQNRNNPTWEQVHKTTIEFGNQDLSVVPVSACNVADDNAGEGLVRVLLDDEAKEAFAKQEAEGDTVLNVLYFTSRAPEGGWTDQDLDEVEPGTDPIRIDKVEKFKLDLSNPADVSKVMKEIVELYDEDSGDFVALSVYTEGHNETPGFSEIYKIIDMTGAIKALEDEEAYEYTLTADDINVIQGETEEPYEPAPED